MKGAELAHRAFRRPNVKLVAMACLILTACQGGPQQPGPQQQPDVNITRGLAIGDGLGGLAQPDAFKVIVWLAPPAAGVVWNPGDHFLASLNIGTLANPGKYGGLSGLKFIMKLENGLWTGSVDPTYPMEPIACDAQNRLKWRVTPGDSQDVLIFKTRTATMADQRTLRQINAPFIGGTYIVFGNNDALTYHCLGEDHWISGEWR